MADKFICGQNKKQNHSEMFSGYKFDREKSLYKGEGGRVYAEPGMYKNAAYIDIESWHPAIQKNVVLENGFVFDRKEQ